MILNGDGGGAMALDTGSAVDMAVDMAVGRAVDRAVVAAAAADKNDSVDMTADVAAVL